MFPVFRSNTTFGFIDLFQCNQKSKCRTCLPELLNDIFNKLQDEFSDYQLTSLDELPLCTSPVTDIGTFWGEMSKLHDIFLNKPRFFVLSKLAKTLLVLPNSNADSERAFSLVKKIATEFRADLNKDTLCALLSCKMNTHLHCYELKPSAVLIKNAKSATMEYNNSLK